MSHEIIIKKKERGQLSRIIKKRNRNESEKKTKRKRKKRTIKVEAKDLCERKKNVYYYYLLLLLLFPLHVTL